MKKEASILLVLLFAATLSFAQKTPDWVTNKPSPTNSTYLYVIESAFGNTEIQARNQAIARVFQSTAMRLGQPINSEEINRAVQSGTSFDVISRQYNIPINKVCEYTENKSGSYCVYILCQVAKAGNIPVQFDEFNGCYEGANKFYAAEALSADGFSIYRNQRTLSERELRSLLANSQAYKYYDKGMNIYHTDLSMLSGIGGTAIVLGVATAGFGYGLSTIWDDEDEEKEGFINAGKIGLAATATGIVLYLIKAGIIVYGKSNIRKAVNLYNNGALYSQNAIDMEYGFYGSGVFLTFNF